MIQRVQHLSIQFYFLLLIPIFILGSCSKSKEESEPIQKPAAEFIVEPSTVFKGDYAHFGDYTYNSLHDIYEWHFPGGEPDYAKGTLVFFYFGIMVKYDSVGCYPVTLTVSNKAGESTITKNNCITVIEDTLPRIHGSVQGVNNFQSAKVIGTYLNESISIEGKFNYNESSIFIARLPKKYLGKTLRLSCYYDLGTDENLNEIVGQTGYVDVIITKNTFVEFPK